MIITGDDTSKYKVATTIHKLTAVKRGDWGTECPSLNQDGLEENAWVSLSRTILLSIIIQLTHLIIFYYSESKEGL
jgi:hypothetical protein